MTSLRAPVARPPKPPPAQTAPVPASPRRRRRTRLVAVLLVLAIALSAYAFYVFSPRQAKSFEDPESLALRSQTTNLFAALAAGGIDDPFVSIVGDVVRVSYNRADLATPPDDLQRFVLGAVATAAPDAGSVVADQFVNGSRALRWSVELQDVRDHLEGRISADDLEARIAKRSY